MSALTSEERRVLRERIDAARRDAEAVRVPAADERRCFGCDEIKPLEEFSLAPNKHKGLSYQCKPCKAAYAADYKRRRRSVVRADGSGTT